jgi:hypothetical protein
MRDTTTGRPSWRSSFLGDPDAQFFGEKRGRSKNREKRKKAWWKRTPLLEIRKERGFPPRLEKASPTTLGFFTVPTGPTAVINSKLFSGQRFTLSRLNLCLRKSSILCPLDIHRLLGHTNAVR